MTGGNGMLDTKLLEAGFSKTVYALVTPEIEKVLDRVLDGGDRSDMIARTLGGAVISGSGQLAELIAEGMSEGRESFRDMYRSAWTKKQDDMHVGFFVAWRSWSRPVVRMDHELFPFQYPTAGASEALRAVINEYGNRARVEGFEPVIHVFDGEYEGYAAFAAAAGIRMESHCRRRWVDAVEKIGPTDQFYISQPSAIDGNVWSDFDDFARRLLAVRPGAELMLDLTYVGSVARNFRVKADYPNIPTVFFSLSKPAGVYYHRIGGCLSRRAYGGLLGNVWFKNLLALRLGTAFMESFGVQELPRKYLHKQHQAVTRAKHRLGLDLIPSDVILLATGARGRAPADLERHLARGSDQDGLVRVCLTPAMAELMDPDPVPAGRLDRSKQGAKQSGDAA